MNKRLLLASAALAITWGSTASKSTNGRFGVESKVCIAFNKFKVRSVSQESKASTTPTKRLCCPVKASKH